MTSLVVTAVVLTQAGKKKALCCVDETFFSQRACNMEVHGTSVETLDRIPLRRKKFCVLKYK